MESHLLGKLLWGLLFVPLVWVLLRLLSTRLASNHPVLVWLQNQGVAKLAYLLLFAVWSLGGLLLIWVYG